MERIDTYRDPHAFIEEGYQLYPEVYKEFKKQKPAKTSRGNSSKEDTPRTTNGKILEYLICETLAKEGITPFYYQASFLQISMLSEVKFDIVLYDPIGPVVLSIRNTSRERVKKDNLEGLALKETYENASLYLLARTKEQAGFQKKIAAGSFSGIESCLRPDRPAYNGLLQKLARQNFTTAEEPGIITGDLIEG